MNETPRAMPEKMATIVLCPPAEEGGRWDAEVEVVGHPEYDVYRDALTAGELLDWADKWARDRGLYLGLVRTEAYRTGTVTPAAAP